MSGEENAAAARQLKRSGELVEYRLKLLERAVEETSKALSGINTTLQQLASLEVRHTETREALTRAFASIAKLDERVEEIEAKIPVLILTSNWVRLGVIGLVALVCTAVVKLILVTH